LQPLDWYRRRNLNCKIAMVMMMIIIIIIIIGIDEKIKLILNNKYFRNVAIRDKKFSLTDC